MFEHSILGIDYNKKQSQILQSYAVYLGCKKNRANFRRCCESSFFLMLLAPAIIAMSEILLFQTHFT